MPVITESTHYDILGLISNGDEPPIELWLRPYITACVWEEQPNELAMRLRFVCANEDPTPLGYLHELLPMGSRLWLYADYGSGFQEVNRFVLVDWGYEDEDSPVFAATCYDDLWYLQNSQWERLYPDDRSAKAILLDLFGEFLLPVGEVTGPNATLSKFPVRGALASTIQQIIARAFLAGDDEYYLSMRGGLVHVLQFGTNDTTYVVESGVNSMGMTDHESIADLVTEVRVVGNASNGFSEDPSVLDELGFSIAQAQRLPITQVTYGHQHFGRLVEIINGSSGDTPALLAEEVDAIMQERGEPRRTRTVLAPDFPIRKGDLFTAIHGTLNGRYAAVGVVHDADAGTVALTVDSGGTLAHLKKKIAPAKKNSIPDIPENVAEIGAE